MCLGQIDAEFVLVKTEQIDDPQVFFNRLKSDEITVLDADLVSNEIWKSGTSTATSSFNLTPIPTWLLLRLRLRMHVCNATMSSTCYRSASCTTTLIRSFISANPVNPNLNWVIILAILPTNLEVNISRYSRQADQGINAIKPIVKKLKSKYARSHWIVRRDKKSTSR